MIYDKKKSDHEYYLKNRERILKRAKKYRITDEGMKKRKLWNQANPESKESKHKRYINNKIERLQKMKIYANEHKEEIKEYKAAWMRQKKYGITPAEQKAMFESQGLKCAICETDGSNENVKWSIDHCHQTNVVRGILCQSCNGGLGMFKDNINKLTKAVAYLQKLQFDYKEYAGNCQWL